MLYETRTSFQTEFRPKALEREDATSAQEDLASVANSGVNITEELNSILFHQIAHSASQPTYAQIIVRVKRPHFLQALHVVGFHKFQALRANTSHFLKDVGTCLLQK